VSLIRAQLHKITSLAIRALIEVNRLPNEASEAQKAKNLQCKIIEELTGLDVSLYSEAQLIELSNDYVAKALELFAEYYTKPANLATPA
jgi:hypothetical protein